MTPDLASTFVDQPEGRLHVYHTTGDGPTVLLLSGAGIDNAMLSWRHLFPVLEPDHRVLALDWPKQGRSAQWRGRVTHERMLQCMDEVLDHFQVDRASLVGLSQGGALALAYAMDRPHRVDRVVALAPAGIISFPPVVHQLLWLVAKVPLLHRTLPSLMFRNRRGVESFARKGLFAGPVDDLDDLVDEILEEVRRGGAGASDWQNGSIGFRRMNVDLRPRLPEIAAPVLFIQGDKDAGVAAKHTAAAAELVPNARLELLAGNGHWSNRQSPELVNSLIRDFLR